MKKGVIWAIIILPFMVLFCNKDKEETKYHWVTGKDSINQIYKINRQEKGDSIILSYFAYDTLNYTLFSGESGSSSIEGSYEDGFIRPFKDTTILFGGVKYRVTKYIQNENVTDGGIIHYYNPDIGVFAIHSDTWPGLQYLQSTDSIQSKQIKALIKATVPQFYIRGELKNEIKNL